MAVIERFEKPLDKFDRDLKPGSYRQDALPGEGARAPVSRSFGRGLRRQAHDLGAIDVWLAPTARQFIFYRRDPP